MLLLGTIRLLIFRIFKKKSTKMWLLLKVLLKEKAKNTTDLYKSDVFCNRVKKYSVNFLAKLAYFPSYTIIWPLYAY